MSGNGASSRNLDDLLVGIDERDLTDLIEGQLDDDRRHDLESMLIKRPELRCLVESMRGDRSALRAMPDEFCHVDLAQGVRDVLEREALLGAGQSELAALADVAPAPISISLRWSGTRQLALAAGLLLLVGGGAFFAWPLFNPPGTTRVPSGTSPGGVPSLALNENTARHGRDLATPNAPAIDPMTIAAQSADKAVGTTPKDANAKTSDALSSVSPTGEESTSAPIVSLADSAQGASDAGGETGTEVVGPEIPSDVALARALEQPIDDAHAGELAIQGRLLVRVQGASAAYVLSSSAERGTLGSWRVDHVEPHELASPVLARVFEGAATPEHIVWASDHATPVYDREVVGPEGYVVEFAATPQGIAKVRESLGGRVTFEELPEDAGLRPRIDPDAVLWWTLPPSSWAQRVAAPIILEH